MRANICHDLRGLLDPKHEQYPPAAPSPSVLVAHIAGCASCRAVLAQVAAQFAAPGFATPISCARSQDDLAAYIDLVRDAGSPEALRTYPQLWWHLWTCADCSETYRLTMALVKASDSGELAPLPFNSLLARPAIQKRELVRRITLPRAWFAQVLTPQLGQAWGVDDDDLVIHEGEEHGYQISVALRRSGADWHARVEIDPPMIGDVVISLGSVELRAPFSPEGVALLGPIDAILLSSPTGPDMAVTIDPREG